MVTIDTTKALDALFRRMIKTGSVRIVYPSGHSITYGTGKPDLTVQFKTPHAINAFLLHGTLGFGEAYMDGDIEIQDDPAALVELLQANKPNLAVLDTLQRIPRRQANNRQTQRRQLRHHYALGNDFYGLWLDKQYRAYSCAYFENGNETLEQAQGKKIRLILRKLELAKDMSLLDIGCGWGGLLLTAAQEYGISGLGITEVQEQCDWANQEAERLGVADKVRFELMNYQDLPQLKQQFDRVVSVGMFEHVGRGNLGKYFDVLRQILKPDGVSVLHTIVAAQPGRPDPWIDRYIFPGAYIPTMEEIDHEISRHNFYFEHVENLGLHYAKTLGQWQERFETKLDQVIATGKDERFVRMWRLYLACSRGSFASGGLLLCQYTFRPSVRTSLPTHYYGPLTKN